MILVLEYVRDLAVRQPEMAVQVDVYQDTARPAASAEAARGDDLLAVTCQVLQLYKQRNSSNVKPSDRRAWATPR
jgi:hypothetical protein